MLWEYLPPDRNPLSLVRIEGSSKRRKKPRVLTPEEFSLLAAAVDPEPCHTMVILALCTGVRCSELVALKWSDFDWQNLSVYIRRAIVMQHNHLSPGAVKTGLGPIGWDTLRHTSRAWLGDNGEPLTVQKDYLWRRDDGIDARGAWASGDAGDGALMGVSGRQRIVQVF